MIPARDVVFGTRAIVLAAAEATGARLLSMENVYMSGRPNGRPLTEDRDHDAHTTKGRLRGRMARDFLAALDGKTATVLGDPDQPHTYTYIPDIGEGLAVLGEHPDAPGQVWHLPNDPDIRTTRQLVDIVYRQAGHPAGRLRAMP